MALTLDKDEVIVYEVRRHWVILAAKLLSILFFAFAPVFAYAVLISLPITVRADGNPIMLYLFMYMLWLLIAWIGAVVVWTDYFLDVLIITSKRLIRVEQHGLFSREISYLDLQNIQDVKTSVHGLIATSMNFGNLTVQTAAQHREFMITSIADPFGTRDRLNQAITLYHKEHPHTYVFAGDSPSALEQDKLNKLPHHDEEKAV